MKAYVEDLDKELQQRKAENDSLRCELKMRFNTCQELESEKEVLQKQYNKLLEEVTFLRGQVLAFQYCISEGRMMKK